MRNLIRREYLWVALVIVAVLAAFVVKATSAREEFSICGDFCKRLGCKHESEGSLTAATAEDSQDMEEAKAPFPTCQLSKVELGQRMGVIRELYDGVLSTRELADGYEMTFPGTAAWAQKLFDLVLAERQCCTFFLFELKFEPDRGPIRLSLRGGPQVKEFLERFELQSGA